MTRLPHFSQFFHLKRRRTLSELQSTRIETDTIEQKPQESIKQQEVPIPDKSSSVSDQQTEAEEPVASHTQRCVDKTLCDEEILASFEKVAETLFGSQSSQFLVDLLHTFSSYHDIEIQSSPLSTVVSSLPHIPENKHITYSVDAALHITHIIEQRLKTASKDRLEVVLTISTPTVLNGDSYVTELLFVLSRTPNNTTRIHCLCSVVWSRSSWMWAKIEEQVVSDQIEFLHRLLETLDKKLLTSDDVPCQITETASKRNLWMVDHTTDSIIKISMVFSVVYLVMCLAYG